MKKWTFRILVFLTPWSLYGGSGDFTSFFSNLQQLKFGNAKMIAAREENYLIRAEMIQLADILFYGGQNGKKYRSSDNTFLQNSDKTLSILRFLNAGYSNLFYDQLKGDSYRHFYKAYQLATESGASVFIKASIYGLLKYYSLEIAQNSNSFGSYLRQLKDLRSDSTDDLWSTIYEMIFLSKSLTGLDDAYYFTLLKDVDRFEKDLDPKDPLLAYLYYEKALGHYLQNDFEKATANYQKTIEQSSGYPYLNTERFLSLIKLTLIATNERQFDKAKSYLRRAKRELNKADTLRSHYYLNLYGSLLLNAENKNDSAYTLLMQAYKQEFQLDFRRNTLEVNRLNVELDTQEKENANLRLREGRIWLLSALLITALLSVATYLAYSNQRVKNKIQVRDSEASMVKLLKEQELIGINSMLEGQDKERQRLANELHDNLGSLLTTLKFHFHAFRDEKVGEVADSMPSLEKAELLIDEAYQKVRTIAHIRNAGVPAQDGLLPSIKNFAAKVSLINRLVIDVNDHGMDKKLESNLEITIFRIVQELVANILKHAHASTATIHLTQHEESINIMIEDNGVGFEIAQIKSDSGMGLHSIQKRVENLGGSVTIDSIPKNGTTVIIDLPLL